MAILKRMRYKSKLILCYIIFVSFPLILCFYLLYQSIVKPVQDNTINSIHQRMEQTLNTVQSKVDKIRNVSYLLSTNTVINTFLSPRYYSDLELIELYNSEISPLLSWLEASNPELSFFNFFTNNSYIPNSKFFHQYDDFQQETWMQHMEQFLLENGYYLESCHLGRNYGYGQPNGDQHVYSLFYPLFSSKNYLEVSIKPEVFFNDINTVPVLNSGFMAAVNKNGQIISSQIPPKLQEELEKLFTNGTYLTEEPSSTLIATLFDTEYFITIQKMKALDSWLTCIVPHSEITGSVTEAQKSFMLIIVITLVGTALLSYVLSSLLIRRIHKIIGAVHKIQQGDFHVHIPVQGSDEIDQLATDINFMSFQINELINQVYKSKILQKETELSALQAQINPHFLFNILETFKMIAIIHDLDDFSDSIAALGNLMRYNIAPTSYHVSLEHELKTIKDYINIQNLLLNNRVSLDLSVSSDLLSMEMPNFILQPIIENSFVHGFEHKLDELLLKITICRETSHFMIKIEDNGSGISQKKQEILRKSMIESTQKLEITSSGKSIGITNVNLRLFLLYKSSYRFLITDSDLGGACIILTLPFQIASLTQEEDLTI